jgi:hypothetical protein
MRRWTGPVETAHLTSGRIRPIQFRDWKAARRDLSRRTKDLAVLEELRASIPENGLLEPIHLGISDRHLDVYVGDGHHRAVVLMELGVRTFPVNWYWITNFGVRMEREPFPYELLERA